MRATDFRCLREFRERSSLPVAELRRRLGVGHRQLTRALGRLEAARLVVRRVDPQNQRRTLAHITNLGSDLARILEGQLTQVYRRALEGLPAQAGASALGALRQLLACLPPPRPEPARAAPVRAAARH